MMVVVAVAVQDNDMPAGAAMILGIAFLAIARWMWLRREQYRHGAYFFDPLKIGQRQPMKWPRLHWYWNIWGSIMFFFILGVALVVGGAVGVISWAI